MSCSNHRSSKGRIEVCHKECVNENTEVFVLRHNKVNLVEVELTPKAPMVCPTQYKPVNTYVTQSIIENAMSNKKTKGKKKKKK